MPVNAAEVQGIVNLARSRGITIYPRGAGTNLSGGNIPLRRGIVLSFQKMNRIVDVTAENLTAIVEPGVVIQEAQRRCRASRLDLSSRHRSHRHHGRIGGINGAGRGLVL